MFYVDDMTLPNGKQPWYFNIADLKAEYKRQQQERGNGNNLALTNNQIQLVEMMSLFRTASRRNDWSIFSSVVFIPVRESKQVAMKIIADTMPGSSPYNFDKVFLVGSSK
jgi:hypothetical protein